MLRVFTMLTWIINLQGGNMVFSHKTSYFKEQFMEMGTANLQTSSPWLPHHFVSLDASVRNISMSHREIYLSVAIFSCQNPALPKSSHHLPTHCWGLPSFPHLDVLCLVLMGTLMPTSREDGKAEWHDLYRMLRSTSPIISSQRMSVIMSYRHTIESSNNWQKLQ